MTSPECALKTKVDFYVLLMVKMALPIIFAVMLIAVYLLSNIVMPCVLRWRRDHFLPNSFHGGPSAYRYLYWALVRSLLVMLTMFYVPLVLFTLQYFDCTYQADGTWSLDSQPSSHCYDATHMDYIMYALFGVVVYIIGIPLIVSRKLFTIRDSLDVDSVKAKYGFLYARFKPQFFYWDILVLLRQCMLVGCLVLMDSYVAVQTMAGITVLYVASLQHKGNMPFVTEYLNKLETLSLVASVMTLLSGAVFYTGSSNVVIMTVLTVMIIMLIPGTIVAVGVITYLEWKPAKVMPIDLDELAQHTDGVVTSERETLPVHADDRLVTLNPSLNSIPDV